MATRARILADYVSSGDELALKAPLISPALVTPNLGTPSAGVMTNVTGMPASALSASGISSAKFLKGDNTWDTAGGSTNASDLDSGTLPDARFPATLPAVSGANLTGLDLDGWGSDASSSVTAATDCTIVFDTANGGGLFKNSITGMVALDVTVTVFPLATQSLFTLPVGYRPKSNLYTLFICTNWSSAYMCRLHSSSHSLAGQFKFWSGDYVGTARSSTSHSIICTVIYGVV